ncbi:MAG: NYN domain-containing protein [Candidatus Kariarchaeaceae archaeon]
MTEDDQFFKFKRQNKTLLFIDGNYMINISRALSLKLDIEKLFDELSKEFFRQKTYWYSALESNLDRSNSTFRFLDRLRYIPRTKVYAGRFARKQHGHFDSALRTDAGIALAAGIVEQAMLKTAEYIILIAADPQYVPAVRIAQRYGCLVRLVAPKMLGDLHPHPELVKTVDEMFEIDSEFLEKFEYGATEQYYEDIDDDLNIDEDGDIDIPKDSIDKDSIIGENVSESLEVQIDDED